MRLTTLWLQRFHQPSHNRIVVQLLAKIIVQLEKAGPATAYYDCPEIADAEHNQAIGRSRGGRTTKIHALTDGMCRPVAFLLTGGNVADCKAGEVLIDRMPPTSLLNADKGYDSDAIRRQVRQRGAFANIPPKANRKWKNCFSPYLYRDRNAIERMFCRLKDFRRIATRYDRLATNFLAAVCIAATVSYWL